MRPLSFIHLPLCRFLLRLSIGENLLFITWRIHEKLARRAWP
uniref:Uncharacterized protein n=1 Tax=Manihot esculenta TaxID=3983 RepID=A0A2C9UZU1_MANES